MLQEPQPVWYPGQATSSSTFPETYDELPRRAQRYRYVRRIRRASPPRSWRGSQRGASTPSAAIVRRVRAPDNHRTSARLAYCGKLGCAPLRDVINTALSPYRTGQDRITISGPPLVLKSRQSLALSLAVHELATNALKYGALSVTSGRVSVVWSSEDQAGDQKFVFVCQEFGGPSVSEPTVKGFGSRLISRTLEEDFRGAVTVS
ncbi:hypothetical protein ABIB85_007327 [Bradyrhizobium sp. JR1.5]